MRFSFVVGRALIVAGIVVQMGACSFVPVVAQKLGVGTVDEKGVAQATAKVFGVGDADVKISDMKKDNTLNGTQVFFAANIKGKSYRCGMLSSFAGESLPKCVKPGEPLPTLQ